MFSQIKLGIIGAGKWGLNHIQTSHKLIGDNLKIVCDINPGTSDKLKSISENILYTSEIEKILLDKEINSVIISTPAETHYRIAKRCLENKKNVLIEKPMTLISAESCELVKLAESKNLKLMVGHVLLYHPAIIEMKKSIDEGKIGKLQYIYSNRLNLGTIRTEENILWSFAPHDISVIQYFIGKDPIYIGARGAAFVQAGIEDTTLTYIAYPDNIHAHIFVSWLHPFKEHRLVVIGDEGMMVFEDSLKTEKLKFYEKGFNVVNGEIEKFESEYELMHYEIKQPLEEEQKHFFNCIINNTQPLTDGIHARDVLIILEKAQAKLNETY